jgi:hypothetical protein
MEVEVAGVPADGPSGIVHQRVMMTTEEHQIVDAGLTVSPPWNEMVDIAPGGRLVTDREHTSQIPGEHRGS